MILKWSNEPMSVLMIGHNCDK